MILVSVTTIHCQLNCALAAKKINYYNSTYLMHDPSSLVLNFYTNIMFYNKHEVFQYWDMKNIIS